jgi:putative ATPase
MGSFYQKRWRNSVRSPSLISSIEARFFRSSEIGERPLADKLRPISLDQVFGQEHLLGPNMPISSMVQSGKFFSIILWGEAGVGKTTIGRILADLSHSHIVFASAIQSGVKELRQIFDEAYTRSDGGQKTILFVDEIHRFNKSQQDSFLPVIEVGAIILIGATTENPSFALNSALLSRCQVLQLKRLDNTALEKILSRAEDEIGARLPLSETARKAICEMANGDARSLLNMVESLVSANCTEIIEEEYLTKIISKRAPLYDKRGDNHYNLISALHKSLRGSDGDAALYWLARMLVGGEDPNFIARRLVRFASEDIGLTDPSALQFTVSAAQAYERLGSPDGELALAQSVLYLASAPKSNASDLAFKKAMRLAEQTGSLDPPRHILNAPTGLMRDLGYGLGYIYDHNTEEGFSGQSYWPSELERMTLYNPVERGFEREIRKRLSYWQKLREKNN